MPNVGKSDSSVVPMKLGNADGGKANFMFVFKSY